MSYRRRDLYNEDSAANLLRSVRQQEAQFEMLSRELEQERRNVAQQLEKCKYGSETASVSSMGSSTDESFVWRGNQGPGSIGDDQDLSDNESQLSGSALVDSCLKVLQERGLSDSRDDQEPFYDRSLVNGKSSLSGIRSNALMNQNWEKDLMEADLTPGQTVKKVVTRTEVRTLRTVDGKVVQDTYDPGSAQTTIERYTFDNRAVNGNAPRTVTKQYIPGDEYRSGRRGPGSQSSVEDYRGTCSPGSQSGPGSEGRQTPTNVSSGHLSDGYHTPTGSRHSSQSSSVSTKAYRNTSQSLPRTSLSGGTPSSSSTIPRSSSASGRQSTTYNLSIKVGDVKGSGTDGNVYIQLFGERGNTAKIQLRQAGDTRNKFEKGRTYKFTVDTVDIGKVDRIKLSHDHTGYGSGFFVEEVEVEVPARQDRVKFPCRCWLAQDVDDGKIEREMFAVTPLPNTSYTMSVKLGEVLSPDTNLYVQLFGEKGETSKIMLRPVGSSLNKFEKGRTYKFTVETVNIGKIDRLRIGHDSKGDGKGIFLEEVEVAPAEQDRTIFPCYCWLAEGRGDNKMEREILPGQPRPPRPNTSYHLAVKTGEMFTAGTDANVYFQLIGSEGETEKIQLRQGGKAEKRFEKGRLDKFIVETVDVGTVQKLRIGHDNNGSVPGWFLEEVAVDVPAHNQHFVFPCHRWLARNEDDGKIERDLLPGVPVSSGTRSPTKTTTTTTTETTTKLESQKVPPPVAKKPAMEESRYSTPTKKVITEELRYTTVSPPQKSVIEEVRYTTSPSKKTVIQEEYRYSTSRKEPAPTPPQRKIIEERMVMKETPPPAEEAPPLRPLEPKQRITQEELTIEEVRRQPYSVPPPKNEYHYHEEVLPPPDEYHFEEKRTDLLASAPDSMDTRKIVAYQLCLKMGDVLGDGTEGNVFIQLFGDKGMTEQIQLRQAGNSKIRFEKGRTYKFTVETVDIGKIDKISVSHDSRHTSSGWYLEEVTVDVPSRGDHTVFPSHCWLASERGDGRIVRDFTSRPCLYHLAIKTGDERSAGTDANVWVQVYGDKGDTGHVQLKKSGMMENLFERGQTDYFTLEAGDVGKIEKLRVGHDGRGPAADWYVEEVILNSAVRGEHLIFPCHAWVAEEHGAGSADKELYPKQPVSDYNVRVKTGNVKNAGTDSNIYLQIFGDKGDTGVIELKQICDTKDRFQRGANTKIILQTVDVGNLEKVRIGHDGRGLGTGWYLEEIVIIIHDECWIFPCNRWLADYEDDGKTERDLYAERKTYAHEPDLQDLIEYLQTDDTTLIVNAANYLQHLSYSDEQVKVKVRELGGIPVLVRLLDHELEEIHRSAAACLLNLSYSKSRDENKLAIAHCYGIEALIRLLKRTRKDEVKEVVLGVLWNLSSCEDLKLRIIEICLIVLVTIIIIPYSGWTKTAAQSNAPIPSIKWSTVFRNASGVLRNVSSAGPEARRVMRDCYGLVDSFVWIIKAPIGKTDIDNKSVENSVCILRNLSYRLENEVDREKYKDAPMIEPSRKEPEKPDPGCMAGCGGASKKKKKGTIKESEQPQIRRDPVEGVELLWQPEIVKSYLSMMAESSNPETLEGSTGAVHNLTACGWRWSMVARSAVRKEKGLPILVELLRMNFDPVVRAVATALRNLAIDPRNKDLIGKYATKDLIHRLPDPEAPNDRVEENTVGAILCAVHQVVNKSIPNAKHVRSVGGLKKIVAIAKSRDRYSPRIVKTANQVLITIWNLVPLRSSLKSEGWEFTKEIGDEFGHVPPTPRPFEDITMPRGRQPPPGSLKREPRPIRAEETSIPQPQFYEPEKSGPPPSTSTKGDGYEGDDEIRRRRAPREVRDEIEMEDIGGYRELDNNPDPERTGGAQALPPAYDSRQPREEPLYAQVDKSKKKMYKLQGTEGQQSDSWV